MQDGRRSNRTSKAELVIRSEKDLVIEEVLLDVPVSLIICSGSAVGLVHKLH